MTDPRMYFFPGDGANPIAMSGEFENDGIDYPEPEPLRPGDTLDVYPVTTALGAVPGYIAVRGRDGRTEPVYDPYRGELNAGGPSSSAEEDDDEPVRPVWYLDDGTETPFGPVERALRADVGTLNTTSRLAGTLIASATALAQAMDRATPDKVAQLGRELREHIKRIEEEAGDDDNDSGHRASLSSPV